jgi:hypothetical protein
MVAVCDLEGIHISVPLLDLYLPGRVILICLETRVKRCSKQVHSFL